MSTDTSTDEVTVALTMTPDAAKRFWTALIYAANRIPREAGVHHTDQMSHEDWLRWGASRLDHACRQLGVELLQKPLPGRHAPVSYPHGSAAEFRLPTDQAELES